MPRIHETAYPRLKSAVTEAELHEIYAPTAEEMTFAEVRTYTETARVGLLVLLKTFQRLGYFVTLSAVPRQIIAHITACAGLSVIPEGLDTYDTTRSRSRHLGLVRARLAITAYGLAARRMMFTAAVEAAQTKEDLADIINVMLEALVRQRYELPAFSTLERVAFTARAAVNRRYYQRIATRLDGPMRARLEMLLTRPPKARRSSWDTIKQAPKSPTVKHMKQSLAHLHWLRSHDLPAGVFAEVPAGKLEQFAAEARSLDLYGLNRLRWSKRCTLAATLLRQQVAKALDELTEMFLRQMHKLHSRGEEALEAYRKRHLERTDTLIALLQDITRIVAADSGGEVRFARIVELFRPDPTVILEQCEAHRAHAGNNYYPFLSACYRSQRAVFFHFLESVMLTSTSPDRSVEEAITFLRAHQATKEPVLNNVSYLSQSWIPDKWWPLVTGRSRRVARVGAVARRYFELCLFSQIWTVLKSGDLAVEGSATFRDYREQLVSPDEYDQGVQEYADQVGLPVQGKVFVSSLREWLTALACKTDASFPANEDVRMEKGEIILRKLERRSLPDGFLTLERVLRERVVFQFGSYFPSDPTAEFNPVHI
jgi:hypothetical protein